MLKSKTEKTTKKESSPVVNKLAELLTSKPERLSLAGIDKSISIDEQIEHITRITCHLRKGFSLFKKLSSTKHKIPQISAYVLIIKSRSLKVITKNKETNILPKGSPYEKPYKKKLKPFIQLVRLKRVN